MDAVYSEPNIVIRNDLEELILRYNDQAEEIVRLALKQWSPNIREYVRTETGLKMGVSEKDVSSIPMSVKNGMPRALSEEIPKDLDVLPLLLILPKLEITVEGIDELTDYSLMIDYENLADGSSISGFDLVEVSKYISSVVNNLKKIDLLGKITAINEDILGCYRYSQKVRQASLFSEPNISEKQSIEIYWLPISLTAMLLDVSIEALTVVVMAHELTHAYTHRGADIDGERWETTTFSHASIEIKEGLAQFYTACICDRLKERFPAGQIAYEKLLDRQSGPYIVHKNWAPNHKARKEVIRAATIKCRKSQIINYERFKELIETEETALS